MGSTRFATVSAWRNTPANRTTGTRFGLRLGVQLRNAWVAPNASTIELELEGSPTISIKLSAAFWNKCPEFKHAEIGDWLRAQNVALPWPKGAPPIFTIERISGTQFRVNKICQTHKKQ